MKTLLSYRIRQRATYVQSLVSTHQDALLPLLTQLLATEILVSDIPITRPAENESDLMEDGGNPAPEVDIVALLNPQTDASNRYLQRSTGLAMATTLAQQGVKPALVLLLSNLCHPSTVGKKMLIQSLALNASDDDITAAAKGVSPAVIDSLVSALQKHKRKPLSYVLLGKLHVAKVSALTRWIDKSSHSCISRL